MRAPILIAALTFLLPACAYGQTAADAAAGADHPAIHHLLDQYAHAVDIVDLKLLAQIWSHFPDVSFICYPLDEGHGLVAIEENVFEKVVGGMFSARDLKMHDVAIYVNGNSAWSEFHGDFQATMRKDGSAVTTRGVVTQVYRKESGQWRLSTATIPRIVGQLPKF